MRDFVLGVGAMIVLAWVIYGLLLAAGVENAGNIAAYSAMGLIVALGLYEAVDESRKNQCPECQKRIPLDATACPHCGANFSYYLGEELP